MSSIIDLEDKVKKEIQGIDIDKLTADAKLSIHLYERLVPIINEVVVASSSAPDYEAAYRLVIDKLRAIHEKVAMEKQTASNLLMTTVGKKHALMTILPELSSAAEESRAHAQKIRVDDIAQRIQSGSIDPEKPRKIGERPESLKNMRQAKKVLAYLYSPDKSTPQLLVHDPLAEED